MCARIFEPEPPDDDAEFPDPELELQELPEVVEVVPQPATKPRDKEFDKLVESALDFLNRALKEVKTEPKYSVIDFFTGVELILKARLLHEHWSLVVATFSVRTEFLLGTTSANIRWIGVRNY